MKNLFEVEIGGGWTFGSSDLSDLPGGKLIFPARIDMTGSEVKTAKIALERARHAAQVRFNGEKRPQRQKAVLERLNGICGCLSGLSKADPLTDDFIEFADRNELNTLISALDRVHGKTAALLVKKLEMFRA